MLKVSKNIPKENATTLHLKIIVKLRTENVKVAF